MHPPWCPHRLVFVKLALAGLGRQCQRNLYGLSYVLGERITELLPGFGDALSLVIVENRPVFMRASGELLKEAICIKRK